MVSLAEAHALCLSLPGAEPGSHFDVHDFRVGGKIFATLRPDGRMAVKVDPAEQGALVAGDPETFEPAPGAWGRQGYTLVSLASVELEVLRALVQQSWRRTAPKRLGKLL